MTLLLSYSPIEILNKYGRKVTQPTRFKIYMFGPFFAQLSVEENSLTFIFQHSALLYLRKKKMVKKTKKASTKKTSTSSSNLG